MLNAKEATLLWKASELSEWRSFEGTRTFFGIVKSFDPNGYLKLEVSQDDIDYLVARSAEECV